MLIWGGDLHGDENEDYSMVTNLSCPHCGVYVEVYLPKDEGRRSINERVRDNKR